MTQSNPNAGNDFREEFNIQGTELLNRVKDLIHEGNVRRIIIKQEGHTVLEIPLTIGVVGAVVAPMLVAIGAIGALMTHCTIEVIRADVP